MAQVPQPQGLADLAQNYTSSANSKHLLGDTSRGSKLRSTIGSEQRTDSLLGTFLVQILSRTRQVRETLDAIGRQQTSSLQFFVLPNNEGVSPSYHVLVLHPEFDDAEPRTVKLQLRRSDIDDAFSLWQADRRREIFDQLREPLIRGVSYRRFPFRPAQYFYFLELLDSVDLPLVRECLDAKPIDLIVIAPPPIELTCVPSPCLTVSKTAAQPASSTAGCVVEQLGTGKAGVTGAYHDLAGWRIPVVRGVTPMSVLGQGASWTGVVQTADTISDSVFVELPAPLPSGSCGLRGPLRGVTPRAHERCSFEGATSGKSYAHVASWDSDLPFIFGMNQLKVLTDCVTTQGDSGAALIDGADHVIGFSFYCTPIGARHSYSAWIWAESVFEFHGLRPL